MTKAKVSKDKPGKEVIYVDVDDDITSIVDKVENAGQKIVALVLPKRFTALQSIVNMRLLKRSADSAGKNAVLITSDPALLPLAGAAGLYVAKNLQSKPEVPPSPVVTEAPEAAEDPDAEIDSSAAKLDYHRSIGELAATQALDEGETIPLEDDSEKPSKVAPVKPPKDKKLKVPNFDRFRLLLGAGIAALVALIIFLIFALFVLPKATVTIKTSSVPVSANLSLTTSDKAEALDESKGIIPASLKSSEQTATQQVPATGQQNLGEKAKGSIKVSNCTNSSITIPAGGGVSSGGLTFITQKTLNLDSGNFDSNGNCKSSGNHVGNTDVNAQQAGEKYNLPAGQTFSVSGYGSGVSGTNSSAFSGGTDNIVTIVNQQDVDNAKKKFTSAESDKFSKEFQQQLSDGGFYVVASTLKLTDPAVSSSPPVGQQAATATVTIKITYSVLVVPKSDLATAITHGLEKQIDKNRQKLSSEDVLKDIAVTVQDQTSPTAATLEIIKDTTAVPIINAEAVKKQIGGLKDSQIRSKIETVPGVKEVKVKFSPFWVSKAPKKISKITIVLQPIKEQASDQ